MKNLFKVLVFSFLAIIAFSCSESESKNQISKFNLKKVPQELLNQINYSQSNNNSTSRPGGPCDEAVSVGISVETDFDIKRPKYDCNSGFWFCSETHTYLHCLDANGNVIYEEEICRSGNNNPKPHKFIIPLYDIDENHVVLSFDKVYFDSGFKPEDLAYFSVDDERLILPNRVMVMGNYEVFDNGKNLIVKIETKKQ